VVDEQHRFGVLQRQAILSKGVPGRTPGILLMSATPIPRSLSLTLFGDMDISVIRSLPGGRRPIETHLAKQSNASKVYEYVRNELKKGRQAYFVYPLIKEITEDDEETTDDTLGKTQKSRPNPLAGFKSAQEMLEKLQKEVFPEYKCAMIHSQVDEESEEAIMTAFRAGEMNILVATSVVEVGVDVPNATCMVIEHAERFGLAALHQLRGRVGRGAEQSYCFLIYTDEGMTRNLSNNEKERLKMMMESNDGFLIAEKDLELRGPGDITGTDQSGYLGLDLADPIRDYALLEEARNDVSAILQEDPHFESEDTQVINEVLKRANPFGEIGI
jgi:ATP-dependent DNA helicase RecG